MKVQRREGRIRSDAKVPTTERQHMYDAPLSTVGASLSLLVSLLSCPQQISMPSTFGNFPTCGFQQSRPSSSHEVRTFARTMGIPFGNFRLNKEKAEKKSVGLQQEQACTSRADVSPSPVGTGQDSPAKPAPCSIAC